MIDFVTEQRPVFVSRLDGHMALANSYALKLSGVTRETKDPPGGLIVRDPITGEPTGVLKDVALSLVARHIPAASRAEKLDAARVATAHAAFAGRDQRPGYVCGGAMWEFTRSCTGEES